MLRMNQAEVAIRRGSKRPNLEELARQQLMERANTTGFSKWRLKPASLLRRLPSSLPAQATRSTPCACPSALKESFELIHFERPLDD